MAVLTVPRNSHTRQCVRHCRDSPSTRAISTSISADNTMRMDAVNATPTAGTVMRWNRNDAPQIMPSRTRRISDASGME